MSHLSHPQVNSLARTWPPPRLSSDLGIEGGGGTSFSDILVCKDLTWHLSSNVSLISWPCVCVCVFSPFVSWLKAMRTRDSKGPDPTTLLCASQNLPGHGLATDCLCGFMTECPVPSVTSPKTFDAFS